MPSRTAIKASPDIRDGHLRGISTMAAHSDFFNPRLLLIRNRAQLHSDESLVANQGADNLGPIQCGLCLIRIQQEHWFGHLKVHYGVGWIVGNKKPDITSRSVILDMMNRYIKESDASTRLYCRMCKRSYRSGLSLLTHIEICGILASRVVCQNCHKSYSKMAMTNHWRACIKRPRKPPLTLCPPPVPAPTEPPNPLANFINYFNRFKSGLPITTTKEVQPQRSTVSNILRPQKSNWLQPQTILRCPHNPCTYVANDRATLADHAYNCMYAKEPSYYCWLCKLTICFTTEDEAVSHVARKHYANSC